MRRRRKIRVCKLTRSGNGFSDNDTCETLYLHVAEVDANGARRRPSAWMYITYDGGPKGARMIRLSKPPFVSHVIRGFTLTLPPHDPKDFF